MKYIITGLLLLAFAVPSWAETNQVSGKSEGEYDLALTAAKGSPERRRQAWVRSALLSEADKGNPEAMYWYGVSLSPSKVRIQDDHWKMLPMETCIWLRNAVLQGYSGDLALALHCQLNRQQLRDLEDLAGRDQSLWRYYVLSKWNTDANSISAKNDRELFAAITKLANKGDHLAQYRLFFSYSKQLGRYLDHTKASFWYLQARFNPDPEEWNNAKYAPDWFQKYEIYKDDELKEMLEAAASEDGVGPLAALLWFQDNYKNVVPQKLASAASLLESASSLYNLGLMYANGTEVAKDEKEAVKFFKLAAEQGFAMAQFALGVMYANGRGVNKRFGEAAKWYRLAAEQGDAAAQSNLGAMYANGEGVLKDDVYAYLWSNIAAASGNEVAKSVNDILVKRMTPQDISKAQDLARECVKKNYKDC